MERRAMLALVLSMIVLALWNHFFLPDMIPEVTPIATSAQNSGSSQVKSASVAAVPNPGTPSEASQAAVEPMAVNASSEPERQDQLQTSAALAEFTSVGGGMRGLTLQNYTERVDPGGLLTWLWNGIKSGGTFGELIPEQDTDPVRLLDSGQPYSSLKFSPDGNLSAAPISEKVSAANASSIAYTSRISNLTVKKQYRATDDPYFFEWKVVLENTSGQIWTGRPAIALTQIEKKSTENPFEVHNSVAFIDEEAEFQDLLELDDGGELDALNGRANWIGLSDNYFLSAIIIPDGVDGEVRTEKATGESVMVSLHAKDVIQLAPGASQEFNYYLYVGPKEIDRLTDLGHELKQSIDFGMLSVFCYPLLYLLKFFYGLIGSYGLAIILLTVSIKSLTLPLTHKSMASMQRMKEIQPEIKKLQTKYGDNKEALNQEMMKLMAEKKVNPLGGCLPTVIQIPIWFSLYRVLQSSIELYHTPFFYVDDLSVADPYGVSSILVGVLMFVQQKLQPQAATMDPAQQKMLQFMPLVFSFILFSLPSGLVLYIFVNSLLSILHHTFFLKKAPTPA